MSRGCSYCGMPGHSITVCEERLEDYFGTPCTPSEAMADKVEGGADDDE